MTEAKKPETLYVEDIDHFTQILFAWHENKVKVLEHMLQIPQDAQVILNDEEPILMTAEMHAGFLLGITISLMELGQLPFAAEVDEEVAPATDEPVQH